MEHTEHTEQASAIRIPDEVVDETIRAETQQLQERHAAARARVAAAQQHHRTTLDA